MRDSSPVYSLNIESRERDALFKRPRLTFQPACPIHVKRGDLAEIGREGGRELSLAVRKL